MPVTMQEVSEALAELGRLRFGEMRVEDAMHDIVRSTHAIFDVDGAGLMLADREHQLRSMMQGQQQSELAAQLQGALSSRAVIEQAKGVLIGRHGLAPHEAYQQLRDQARAERRKLVAVCAEVVRNAARS